MVEADMADKKQAIADLKAMRKRVLKKTKALTMFQ